MTSSRPTAAPTLLIVVCTLVVTACPLPIARTEASSAPLVGGVVWADGGPAAELDVAVSTGWDDRSCTAPEVRTRTGADGRFELPGTQKHYKTTWFIPNLDLASPRYRLCLSVRDTLRPAYEGYGSLGASAAPDSVSCVIWERDASPRVSCTGHAERAVVVGGTWTDSASGSRSGGFYRLFVTEETTRVRGYDKDKPQERHFVYVQWVEPAAGDAGRHAVRATTSLEYDRSKVWSISDVRLWRREGRWMASLEGYKHSLMNDMARAELVFELGAPGQATLVAGP